jgi:hypothetical protein
MSRVTKMSAPLPQTNSDQMALPWMSSAEDSLAKTSHTQGGGQAWKAQDQDYGAKSPAWLASYDRNTSSWKTSQHSLVEGLDEFSETWPRSGTTRSGIAYQLPPLALRTYGTGFGSSPTHSILTPTAQDHIERQSTSTSVLNYETNKSVSLDRFAKMWPTPRVQSSRGSGPSRVGNRMDLQTAVHLWPTPKSRDWKDGASAGTFQRSSPDLGKVVGQSTTTGALNPTWVEWLMGFPLGWTVSKAWETRSSRKSLKSLAGQS